MWRKGIWPLKWATCLPCLLPLLLRRVCRAVGVPYAGAEAQASPAAMAAEISRLKAQVGV